MKITKHVSVLLVAGLLIVGCQQNRDKASESGADTSAIPLQITEVRVGATSPASDGRPQPQTTKMPVMLEVSTRGGTAGTQLEAKLINLKNGQQAGFATKRIVASGPAVTRLVLESGSDWSAGRYLVEIKLDGKLVEQRDVDIFDPPPSP